MPATPQDKHLEAERQLSVDLEEYAGCWVAVKDHRVAHKADTLKNLLIEIRGKEVDRILQVAEETGSAAFF